jgi:dienelactone hydrolase
MTEILLFHHAHGQTRGFLAFADELRAAGHVVHVPDLYDGKTFTDLDEGVGYAKQVGFGTIAERGRLAADGLPNELVYGGFSLGALPAQLLAQTRPGAQGALLFHAAFPAAEFGGSWPPGVPLQIHMMEDDPWAEGIAAIDRKLRALLEREDVRPMDPTLGQTFDPRLHQAISYVPGTGRPAGEIVSEFQRGYHVADRVLRPALVAVSAGEASTEPTPAQQQN